MTETFAPRSAIFAGSGNATGFESVASEQHGYLGSHSADVEFIQRQRKGDIQLVETSCERKRGLVDLGIRKEIRRCAQPVEQPCFLVRGKGHHVIRLTRRPPHYIDAIPVYAPPPEAFMAKKKAKAKAAAKRVVAKKKSVAPIPKGRHSITPSFAGPGVDREIEFVQAAFGATVKDLYKGDDGKVQHCELKIGDSWVMCGEGMDGQEWKLHASLYVKDCDTVFAKAVAAGATVKEPLTDKFYGDRNGRVVSPFGNEWHIGTHKEDVSRKEMERRIAQFSKGDAA